MSTPVTVSGLFFRTRMPARVTRTASGTFQLTLPVVNDQGQFRKESWMLIWAGPDAEAFWDAHSDELPAGQPLRVRAENPRAFLTGGRTEIHASVLDIELAPVAPSWTAHLAAQAPTAEKAAA